MRDSPLLGRLAQRHGHQVTLLPPTYVRPFVRRNKTDRADAEALVDAARSDRIPAVAVKRVEQQALVGLLRLRRTTARGRRTCRRPRASGSTA